MFPRNIFIFYFPAQKVFFCNFPFFTIVKLFSLILDIFMFCIECIYVLHWISRKSNWLKTYFVCAFFSFFSTQFYVLLQRNKIAMSNLQLRSLTIFAPTNEAFQRYNGSPVQVQYHMCKYNFFYILILYMKISLHFQFPFVLSVVFVLIDRVKCTFIFRGNDFINIWTVQYIYMSTNVLR